MEDERTAKIAKMVVEYVKNLDKVFVTYSEISHIDLFSVKYLEAGYECEEKAARLYLNLSNVNFVGCYPSIANNKVLYIYSDVIVEHMTYCGLIRINLNLSEFDTENLDSMDFQNFPLLTQLSINTTYTSVDYFERQIVRFNNFGSLTKSAR